MPRACVPYARVLASAESPLLPLLAPRVFADPPFPKRSRRGDDGRKRDDQKKVVKRNRRGQSTVDGKRDTIGEDRSWTSGSRHCAVRASTHGETLAGLSRNSLSSKLAKDPLRHDAMGLRYSVISTFARQQLRCYSTSPPDDDITEVRPTSPSRYRTTRRSPSSKTSVSRARDGQMDFRNNNSWHKATARAAGTHRTMRSTGRPKKTQRVETDMRSLNSKTRRITSTSRIIHTPRKATYRVPSNALFNARRIRGLFLTRRRMAAFFGHVRRDRSERALMSHGSYRSLRRRHLNFSRQASDDIDATQHEGELERSNYHLQAFAALDRVVHAGVRRRSLPVKIRHDPRCISWTATLWEGVVARGEEQLFANWTNFVEELREACWPYLMLYFLDRMPRRALQFVRLIAREPSVKTLRPEMLADALEHLTSIHVQNLYQRRGSRSSVGWNRNSIVPTFYNIFKTNLASHRHLCTQNLLLNVARLAHIEDLKRVFDLLVQSKTHLLYDTWLHYANTFAKEGEHQYALRCLKQIWHNARDPDARQVLISRERFRWTCALILRGSTGREQDFHETTGIVAAFVELGVKMDILLYNVIIRNAMEAGDYATAFRVYNTLEENGLKADKFTFSILLHGCTTASDPVRFHDFAQYCAQIADKIRDPMLATDYLYYLYARHHSDSTDAQYHSSTQISQAYARFFSMSALDLFGAQRSIPQSSSASTNAVTPVTPEHEAMEPTAVALYIVLQLEIQAALSFSNHRVWHLYLHFRQLVRQHRHPVLNELAQTPTIWNAFLLAFCKKQQFANASQVIQDMTESKPQPNIFSWNIFMQAFFKTDQIEAAERVAEIMRSRGVEPDQFTYGVLLRGYAKAQRTEDIGEVMQYVENEQEFDPQLLQMLARVHQRKRLMLALEKAKFKKNMRAKQMAEEKAEEERARWAPPSFTPMYSTSEDSEAAVEVPQGSLRFKPLLASTTSQFGANFGFKSVDTEREHKPRLEKRKPDSFVNRVRRQPHS